MLLEFQPFFNSVKQHYHSPLPLASQKDAPSPIQHPIVTKEITLDLPVNDADLVSLADGTTLILLAHDQVIKIMKCAAGSPVPLKTIAYFPIEVDILDDYQEFDGSQHWTEKERKFFKECRQFSSSPNKEQLHCAKFAHVKGKLYALAAGALGILYSIEIKKYDHAILKLEAHYNMINCIAANSLHCFSSAKDGMILQWNPTLSNPQVCYRDVAYPDLECLAVSCNEAQIVGAYSDGYIRLWEQCEDRGYQWNDQIEKTPLIRIQTPHSDLFPQITQIFLLKQTILVKHLNGLIDYFVLDHNQTFTLAQFEMNDNNQWESIGFFYPYVAFNLCERLQIHDIRANQQKYSIGIDQILQPPYLISRMTHEVVFICSAQKLTLIYL